MYKKLKNQYLEIFDTMIEAEDVLKKFILDQNNDSVINILSDMQEASISIGNSLNENNKVEEKIVRELEKLCELFWVCSQGGENQIDEAVNIRKSLEHIQQMIRNINLDNTIVFFPYKASMWDSLESIWIAANKDENCNAVVVPIPYYEKNAGIGSAKMQYEGNEFPDYVPVVAWENYNLEEEHPDVVYIHNPYDDKNHVTSVHQNYYSRNIRPYTECLVYVPYYSTSGGMSIGQEFCPVYAVVDYIVIQTSESRKYFDRSIPVEKFLPFGSPKFDSIINKLGIQLDIPEEWKEKMKNKKVYFYNTSLNGMLENTLSFLKKMEYVFNIFKKSENACLLWRPHPLLESTFDSMRPSFKSYYNELRKRFFDENLGIYDDTPDITNSVAVCDAYVGDIGSSVTSLFGIAGKPVFILNNYIHSEPKEEDWRAEIITGSFIMNGNDAWMMTPGNKLYYSNTGEYSYKYCCSLDECSTINYSCARTFGDKDYICPQKTENIPVISNGMVSKRIELEHHTDKQRVFAGSLEYENYIILIPCNYGSIVMLNTKNDEVEYINDNIKVFVRNTNEGLKVGAFCIYKNFLITGSPVDDYMYILNLSTKDISVVRSGGKKEGGCTRLVTDEEYIWIIPRFGSNVKKWNPLTGELHEYEIFPDQIKYIHVLKGSESNENPFGNPAVTNDAVYLPYWRGNLSVRIDKKSGSIEKWTTDIKVEKVTDYFIKNIGCHFIRQQDENSYLMFCEDNRCLYNVDLESGKCKKIEIKFDKDELKKNSYGFSKCNQALQYAAMEGVYNTLSEFLKGNWGKMGFDKKEQVRSFENITLNTDGTCGEKIHEFIFSKLSN